MWNQSQQFDLISFGKLLQRNFQVIKRVCWTKCKEDKVIRLYKKSLMLPLPQPYREMRELLSFHFYLFHKKVYFSFLPTYQGKLYASIFNLINGNGFHHSNPCQINSLSGKSRSITRNTLILRQINYQPQNRRENFE